MKKILLTGGTGFIGRNIKPILDKDYIVYSPGRTELDLTDSQNVKDVLIKNNFDVVIHAANPNPVKNILDAPNKMLDNSLRSFYNLYQMRQHYQKMIFFGSGAEYDKRRAICKIKENDLGRKIPGDEYGFAKLIMNELARSSENVYNCRIFGCYGPTDHESKFITHAIHCCMRGEDITIRQNCFFDYMHVYDLGRILTFFIDKVPLYHDYNVCSGLRVALEEIALEVQRQMKAKNKIVFLNEGMNKEYTGSNLRLLEEIGTNYKFISLAEGIKIQIESERQEYEKKSS